MLSPSKVIPPGGSEILVPFRPVVVEIFSKISPFPPTISVHLVAAPSRPASFCRLASASAGFCSLLLDGSYEDAYAEKDHSGSSQHSRHCILGNPQCRGLAGEQREGGCTAEEHHFSNPRTHIARASYPEESRQATAHSHSGPAAKIVYTDEQCCSNANTSARSTTSSGPLS